MLQDNATGLRDSGERIEYVTGAIREPDTGRGRFDLISPIAMRRLAKLYEKGALKYLPRNWERGQSLSRYINSALRHLCDHLEGDTQEDHLIACAWNCFSYVHVKEMIDKGLLPAELDDLYNKPASKKPLEWAGVRG